MLRAENIGIHDNFFDLGGASIQTLEVVSHANQAGLHLTPEMIFRYQNIAELAEACAVSAPAPSVNGHCKGKLAELWDGSPEPSVRSNGSGEPSHKRPRHCQSAPAAGH